MAGRPDGSWDGPERSVVGSMYSPYSSMGQIYPGMSSGMPCGSAFIDPYRMPPDMRSLHQPIYSDSHFTLQKGGGGVGGIWNNILNKEWLDMCGMT